ncbi:MAG TPA: hypothetical protein VEH50_03675 [Methylomirabilota bacterium]|nr:hypothetical protein [Methylomirabilota bacterium]
MIFDRNELISKLKLELAIAERGGYYPSPRDPQQSPRIFRDSISCLNAGLEKKEHPCTECFLMCFVPSEHRDEPEPCHFIPLNSQRDTVASLGPDPDVVRGPLIAWLRRTIDDLETEGPRTPEWTRRRD